jgi:hypothetical protein
LFGSLKIPILGSVKNGKQWQLMAINGKQWQLMPINGK